MTDEPKKIDRDTYLKALGLFTLAHQHSLKTYEFEAAMLAMIGLDAEDARIGGSHISAAIYSTDEKVDFNEVLKRDGYIVESP